MASVVAPININNVFLDVIVAQDGVWPDTPNKSECLSAPDFQSTLTTVILERRQQQTAFGEPIFILKQ